MGRAMVAWLQQNGDEVTLALRIQPRASRDEIVGPYGDRLKLRITSPPVDGAANDHLCRFLAGLFRVPQSRVRLLRGSTGRDKLVVIAGVSRLPEAISRFAGPADS